MAFVLAVILGWLLIPILKRLKIGQSIREVGPKQHLAKAGTPTMGGLIFLLAGVISALVFMPRDSKGYLVLFAALAYGCIGFADDYLKVVLKQPLGLKARYKLLGELAAAVLFYLALRTLNVEHALTVPFWGKVQLGALYPLLVTVVLVATTNAVNLADGVDGLAGGLSAVTLLGTGLIAWMQGEYGLTYVAMALVGGILGYLIFNLHPAKVIMGDTGSLAIGGAIAAITVLTGTELLLAFPLGLIFVLETLSVIIQVTYFKITGRRVFLMAPIHHHFELKGWSEWKVCFWFWSLQSLGVVVAIALWLAAY
jgi:phospho-N-acetylmuramoyl-pentapeptide-transferase